MWQTLVVLAFSNLGNLQGVLATGSLLCIVACHIGGLLCQVLHACQVFIAKAVGVQMGGMALHEGKVAEMRTGEGKTLAAVLPAYLNALPGRGVHLVTVNAYLAARDCEWCARPLFPLGRPSCSSGVLYYSTP